MPNHTQMKRSFYSTLLLIVAFCVTSSLIFPAKAETSTGGCGIDSIVVVNPVCYGSCVGTVQIYAHATSTLYYSYSQLGNETSSFVDSLCPGTYNYSITDSAGCLLTGTFDITDPAPIGFSIAVVNTTCPGGCTGSLTVLPDDTTATYTYQWPGFFNTTSTLSGLCDGVYSVIVSDSNGCSATSSEEVEYDAPFTINIAGENAACVTACNGLATVVASPPGSYTYSWNTGPIQTTQTATGLCTGIYTVTVIDTTGCQVSGDVVIDADPAPPVTVVTADPACYGTCTGSAALTVGAAGPYLYSWLTTPPQDSSVAINLCEGIYEVLITDVTNGCTYVDSASISNPAPPTVTFSTSPSLCDNICTGSATIVASSLIPSSYLWETGSVTEADSALCPGTYLVTVTDSTGCSTIASVTVSGTSATTTVTPSTCNTICDGTILVNTPFDGLWTVTWDTSPVQNDTIATGLCEGEYHAVLIDSSGCIVSAAATMIANDPIAYAPFVVPVSCYGYCDGTAALSVSGTPPLTITWNTVPPQTGNILSGLCAGNYAFTISDSLGCTVSDSLEMTQPTEVLFSYNTNSNSCANICDATAIISPSAPGSYIYEWQTTPLQYGSSASGLCSGYTAVEITANGCNYQDSVLIIGPDPIFIGLTPTNVTCNGSCDGFISSLIFGGSPAYSLLWSNGFTTPQIGNLCAGNYTVTVTDVVGCTNSGSVTITEPDSLQISFTITNASCITCNDGIVTAQVTGGTIPYTYLWNPGGIDGPSIDSLLTGYYYLCVADDQLCITCDSAFVDFFDALGDPAGLTTSSFLFPNPFSKQAELIITGDAVQQGMSCNLSITDVSGRLVDMFSYEAITVADHKAHLRILNNGLSPGLYFYEVSISGNPGVAGKFIVY